jgi:NAD-dependent dihydropyrimidine dehydrogenase PreA subunit
MGMKKRITAMFFSATDKTRKIVTAIAKELAVQKEGFSLQVLDFTLPKVREEAVTFTEEDVVVLGVPVYAGRVPNILLKYLNNVIGQGALAIPVVVFGNRNYDDALIELKDILEANEFKVIAGGAFVAEHSFSSTLAQSRPDEKDMTVMRVFARQIYNTIITDKEFPVLSVKGNKPYRPYYVAKDKEGKPFDFRRITPKTNSACIDCKLCPQLCPMGSIDYDDVSRLVGPCIKCCACIKKCPVQAKYFDDPGYLNHRQELEIECTLRREPELFILT